MPFPATLPQRVTISQEEWEQALDIAERWKSEPVTSPAPGKQFGLLARALLHVKDCYDTVRAAHED